MNGSALQVTSGALICMDTVLYHCSVDDQMVVYSPTLEVSMSAQLQISFHHHAVNTIVVNSDLG